MKITTSTAPDVPVPAGAEVPCADNFADWGGEYRVVQTPDQVLPGRDDTRVWGAAVQFPDGHIDARGDVEPPHVWAEFSGQHGLTTDEARKVAALIVQVANELDGWVGR